jgi:hypothetical protein
MHEGTGDLPDRDKNAVAVEEPISKYISTTSVFYRVRSIQI